MTKWHLAITAKTATKMAKLSKNTRLRPLSNVRIS